jgi:hypothetical protein
MQKLTSELIPSGRVAEPELRTASACGIESRHDGVGKAKRSPYGAMGRHAERMTANGRQFRNHRAGLAGRCGPE